MVETPGFSTDKIDNGYFPSYLKLAARIVASRARICEVGVYAGESLKMWQCLFPGALVVGVDSQESSTWPPGTIQILSDQTDIELPQRLIVESPTGYDLIVEDASHVGSLTKATWELLWPLVVPGGFYVIEDWTTGVEGYGNYWYTVFGGDMLVVAQSFLPLLKWVGAPDQSDIESIEYRRGMIIFQKTADAPGWP